LTRAPAFAQAEHEKAWLIRVATNICRDIQRFTSRHRWIEISELEDYCSHEEDLGVLKLVMTLPARYKTVIHLYYVEGYSTVDISGILNISVATVKKRMQRGRTMLRLECEKGEVLL
jgi:RNA polymerase sigma-70 factor (ECF subfamily)